MRPEGLRDPIAGPDSGPEHPFPLKLSGEVIKGFGRGSSQVWALILSPYDSNIKLHSVRIEANAIFTSCSWESQQLIFRSKVLL